MSSLNLLLTDREASTRRGILYDEQRYVYVVACDLVLTHEFRIASC